MFCYFLSTVLFLVSSAGFAQDMIPPDVTLEEYLVSEGYYLSPEGSGAIDNYATEGFSTKAQRERLATLVQQHPEIKSILEIGLNGGHSAENFLTHCKNVERFVSIDINWHSYTTCAAHYLVSKYKGAFVFIEGDSREKIPELARLWPEQKFDLIFIDGNHAYEYCLTDILQAKMLARSNAILLVDDYDAPSVQRAVEECQERGIIEVVKIENAQDSHGARSWVLARYLISE